MLTSKENLLREAKRQGYKPEILEKVYRLVDIFQQMMAVPYLKERLVLKGGTALNLFYFEKLPRLSVDIDLNYIGQLNREKMLEEKTIIVDAVHQILLQNQFERHRSPMNHAGGKMVWFYNSVLGQRGSLEIDINFMYRQPLCPIVFRPVNVLDDKKWLAPVLDIHELAAGKLSALFNRNASRDIFDAHYLMTQAKLDIKRLREIFIAYIAMSKVDLSQLTPKYLEYDLTDFKNRLTPVLHQKTLPRRLPELKTWADKMITELKSELSALLPLNQNELSFIRGIRERGHIHPELVTNDKELAEKIKLHPAILWAKRRHTAK